MNAHQHTQNIRIQTLYRRGYRLWNRLYGRFGIKDGDKRSIEPLPGGPHHDMAHVGVVILEGWISA